MRPRESRCGATATLITTNVVSARRILTAVDPRPRVRSLDGWPVLTPTLDLASLHDDWQFECGWSATDAVADTARGLQGRKPGPIGAVTVAGRITLPCNGVPRSAGVGLVSAAPEGAEAEFDDRIDPRFPVFVTTPLTAAHAAPLTPMSLDLHTTGLRAGARAVARLPHHGVAYDSTLRFTHQLRSAVRELARRRVAEEKLATAQDIYFLTVDEALGMPVDTQLRVKPPSGSGWRRWRCPLRSMEPERR